MWSDESLAELLDENEQLKSELKEAQAELNKRSQETYSLQVQDLSDEIAELKEALEKIAEDCPNPNCSNSGSYGELRPSGDVEQVQCEFCWTVKNSRFNIKNAKEDK